MSKRNFFIFPLLVGLILSSVQISFAVNLPKIPKSVFVPKSSKMKSHGQIYPPLGHIQFCNRNPRQCRVSSGSKRKHRKKVILNKKTWSELIRINLRVNRSIKARTDQAMHGIVDKWSVGNRYGDCEDYAIRKRHELMKLGWPSSSVLITTAWDNYKRPHAVLLVKTNRGDFILDNLTNKVRPWRKVPYRWVKQQSEYNPKKWVKLTSYRKSKLTKRRKSRQQKSSQQKLKQVLKRYNIKPVYKR